MTIKISISIGGGPCLPPFSRLPFLPSHGQVVDGDLTHILLRIDDEESTERDSRLFVEHAVVAGNLKVFVREQRNIHLAETALFAGRVYPRKVRKVGIGRRGDHLAVDVVEFLHAIGESNDLGRANKSAEKNTDEMTAGPIKITITRLICSFAWLVVFLK